MRRAWTPQEDARIIELRRTMTWDQVAAAMGLGRNTVLERGRRIGGCVKQTLALSAALPTPLSLRRLEGREALRAGHPFSLPPLKSLA